MKIRLGQKIISERSEPFIVAEVGSNFDQSINKAFKLIDVAKKCKADAVKFQLFDGKVLYPNNKKMRKLFEKNQLNSDWIPILKKYCIKKKINFFLSPFDEKSLDILIKNKIKFYKIASSEIVNLALIKKIAKEKQPVFLSTGMSDLDDVKKAVRVIKSFNNNKIVIMQCCSLYPLKDSLTNLNVLDTFGQKFKNILGFSDHTLGFEASIIAMGKGARVFEKHLTLNKKSKGPDHHYSLNPVEFKNYVIKLKNCYSMLGSSKKEMLTAEKKIGRREGLYFAKSKSKNSRVKKNDLYSKMPSLGVRSKYLINILNKKLVKNVKKNTPVYLENLK